ncbi:hypothetical protein NDU88_001756 [Pleurodeles waltl]|uniref:Uncharacterized protein n=1 Tax=Pleurodeles waltl TaxID=8319 RepID=A0AAV7LDR0_PLEWA|nr:hypothetical protein NDU88_001756 [Pleurodeles waltl]
MVAHHLAVLGDMRELQERVAGVEELGAAAVKTIGNHDQQLMHFQSKIGDLENWQQRNNLREFGIYEGKEGDDPRQFIV